MSDSDLLSVLDWLVRADQGPPGFAGSICVGIRGERATRWWRCVLGRTAETAFILEPDPNASVLVGFDEDEARRALDPKGDREESAPGLRLVSGDTKVLAKFIARYVRSKNFISIRMGGTES